MTETPPNAGNQLDPRDDTVKIEDLSGFVVPREMIASHDSREMAVKMMEWMNERHSGQPARMSHAQMMSYWRNSPRPKSKPKPKRKPWSGRYK